ncbi:phage baseplate assembly protein V [Paraburkholderia fungorum]|nr:phage baseplate assembly protein V [Paraburkholderia fungorum]
MSTNDFALPRLATISSYDASNHAVKVQLQPEDPEIGPQESNWMPLGAIGIGNGWGFAVGPQIDDQVLVVYENGDFSSGTIVARVFSVAQKAIAVPSGEIWAVHQTGSFVKMVTNGDIDVSTAGNLNANVAGNMTANVTGNASTSATNASVTATGTASVTAPSISLGATGQSLMSFVTSAMVAFFNAHTHTSTTPGTPTSTPNQTMGSGQLTSTVKGG